MCLLLAEAAEVRRRDIKQRGNIFQRKKLEEVGGADYQLVVALLWCLGIQVHETVIEGGKMARVELSTTSRSRASASIISATVAPGMQ